MSSLFEKSPKTANPESPLGKENANESMVRDVWVSFSLSLTNSPSSNSP